MSEDTDIYDMDDVMWCLTTRVNPHTDILNPLPGGRGQTFMPAERMTAGVRERATDDLFARSEIDHAHLVREPLDRRP